MNMAKNNFAKPVDAPQHVHNRFGLLWHGTLDVLLKVASNEHDGAFGATSMFDPNRGQHNKPSEVDNNPSA